MTGFQQRVFATTEPGATALDLSVRDRIAAAVGEVRDPELGDVTIAELGLLRGVDVEADGRRVQVHLRATFLGCPALGLIASDVQSAVRSCSSIMEVDVTWDNGAAWSAEDISPVGRSKLASLGIAVAADGASLSCPYCERESLQSRAPVGPTACRSLYWCNGCRNIVEVLGDRRSLPISIGQYPKTVVIRRTPTWQREG